MIHNKNQDETPVYKDHTLAPEVRARDLVWRMTLEEKVSQMVHIAPAIERLDIPEYDWWNECLHGVAFAGVATVFPQSIGLGATFNTELMSRVANVISDEARAKHHEAVRHGERGRCQGLTFWSPNINIFRDPRWGRGQETYGEDPYLTARLGVEFVKGLQGDDPRYLKLVATPKHYAVHSGPELDRHHFDAKVSVKIMRETYLPAFEACIKEGKAISIMGAYNRVNGEPCCASKHLLVDILRGEWKFDGYVVSDCWAIGDFFKHHKVVKTPEEAAAMAVKAGCDLNCGEVFATLVGAVELGLISEETITESAIRLFTARFRLGMFDPPEMVPYARIPFEVNDCKAHRGLALEAARESIVLLKNENDFLPLDKNIKTIAVIGPNTNRIEPLIGNYHGTPSIAVTPLDGIRAKVGPTTEILHAKGCELDGDDTTGFEYAVEIAAKSDVAIVVLGLSAEIEGEEGCAKSADREDITLLGVQEELLKAIYNTGTPIVLVLINGSAIAINWADEHLPAIIEAWYPGEEGGTAIADVLFGNYNPAGRLPVTFYKSIEQLPPFTDYSMQGRTYRYFHSEPLYPFGYGLSYTKFKYSKLNIKPANLSPDKNVRVSVEVENIGKRAGREVVELYISDVEASAPVPIRQLSGFTRIHLAPGEKKIVLFTLKPEQFALFDDEGQRVLEPGEFIISVGGGQPGLRTAHTMVLEKTVKFTGPSHSMEGHGV